MKIDHFKDAAVSQKTVLVVDDTRENLALIGQLLHPDYHMHVRNSGQRALQVADFGPRPDLILLDVMMPEMDGYQVVQRLREHVTTRNIQVIFVTAMNADEDEDEEHGLALGAVNYVTKPIKPPLMLAHVRAHLELKSARDALARQNVALDAEVHGRMVENDLIKDFSLNAFATLADPQARQRIAKAAPLHDIGKVGIPDAILLKPDKLTAEEFEIMKTHASIGAEAIGDAIRSVRVARLQSHNYRNAAQTAQSLDFLETTRQIAGSHHEKWYGSGYPEGIAGDAIPLAARLMALADVFDALISKRHYKVAFTLANAVDIIRQGRGQHFEPDITDAALALIDTFTDIVNRYTDVLPNPSE